MTATDLSHSVPSWRPSCRWRPRITVLHQHHPISRRTEGNFCPEVCVRYDPEVRHRIVKPHKPARVGNQKKRGVGVIPQRGLVFPLSWLF